MPVGANTFVFMQTYFIISFFSQVITYNEYLPGSLGPDAMRAYNLNLGNPSYDDKLDPQAANEFATAAFRFGHNEVFLIRNVFFLITNDSLILSANSMGTCSTINSFSLNIFYSLD